MYPSVSAPACIYGTLKMHKFSSGDSFPKLHLVVLSTGTFNYNRAFSFVSQIKNFSRKFLVSYDVTSLFTNIPLQETIAISINLIFNHNPNLKHH